MTEITIEYCVVCNYLPQALRASEVILKRHAEELDGGVRLKEGPRGQFRVHVDDETVWDKPIEEFDAAEVLTSVRPRIEQSTQASA